MRLNALILADKKLQAEIAHGAELKAPKEPPLEDKHPPPEPIAPELGLHYAMSPMLEYKYPRASPEIVRNVANGTFVNQSSELERYWRCPSFTRSACT